MWSVNDIYRSFADAYRAGQDPDPAEYVARLDGADRRELEALIDGFLARAPGPAYSPEAFAAFEAQPLTQSIQGEIAARLTETWATLLPAERERAELPRQTLVQRLAQALGVADREAKVAAYYERMEAGRLPGRGVSDRVLEALSQIIDVPVARLRAAGERLVPPPPAAAAEGRMFSPAAAPAPARAAASKRPGIPRPSMPRLRKQQPAPERDEVDELFTGGR